MTEKQGGAGGFEISGALVAGVALVVAGLGAIGLEGDVLTRAVRNHPVGIGVAIAGVVLVVAALAALHEFAEGRSGAGVAVVVIAVALVGAISVATWAIQDRERPLIALSAVTAEGIEGSRVVVVTVKASGAGLATDEDWLIQVQAMEAFPDPPDPAGACGLNRRGNSEERVPVRFSSGAPDTTLPHEEGSTQVVWPGPLLLWQQAGPNSTGDTEVESEIEIPSGEYAGVCALITLRGSGGRSAIAYLRLNH